MGQIVSAETGAIENVIDGIVKSIADANGATAQLTQMAVNFKQVAQAPPANSQPDIGALINSTMKAALANSQSVFAATFAGDTDMRSDNGLVNNYCGTSTTSGPGDPVFTAAVTQLKA